MIRHVTGTYYEVIHNHSVIGYIDAGLYYQYRETASIQILEEVVAKLKELNENLSVA